MEIEEVYEQLSEKLGLGEVKKFEIALTVEGQFVEGDRRYWVHTLTVTITPRTGDPEKYEWKEKADNAYDSDIMLWYEMFEELGIGNAGEESAMYYNHNYGTRKIMGWVFTF